ncbi:MAG: SecE/Sec61-gamma subunit of protein translocation complex [Clostridia bacterium]|jgi:preprotein translocase subunit SecE|nr:SecE/Sec61-gamma subunit of protein translocation complex [Clostridia bacterium]
MAEEKNLSAKTELKKAQKQDKPEKKKKPSKIKSFITFCKEVKSELGKVVWPTPKQVINNTVVVIVVIVLSASFISLVDWLFKLAAGLLTR